MSVSTATRFIRRTSFQPDEQHINFTKLDNDILDMLTSPEACEICPSIARVYLRLLRAPYRYWEREGVLYLNGEEGDFGYRTAWQQLINLTGVGNTTLSKALRFLHETGVIGYSAKAAGAGIRIFFNHAQASIKKRTQKNLRLVTTPIVNSSKPETGVVFSGRVLEEVQDNKSRTSVRTQPLAVAQTKPRLADVADNGAAISRIPFPAESEFQPPFSAQPATPRTQILPELRTEDPVEVIQNWFNSKALPKATRIAVKESLDWLKAHGFISKPSKHLHPKGNHFRPVASAFGQERSDLSIERQADELLQTLSSKQKQRWADLLKAEITKQTHSTQLGYWDEQTWQETIRATMQLRLRAALGAVSYCSQRQNAQSLPPEELDDLGQAYGLFAELLEKSVDEVIQGDLEAGKLTSSVARELIDYCRSRGRG